MKGKHLWALGGFVAGTVFGGRLLGLLKRR
jgi:hypothetical protein